MLDHHHFEEEYRIASNRCSGQSFADILSQHALIMVDVARPHLEPRHYVQLGSRLAETQSAWVDLVCTGLDNTVQSELDKRYRRVVTNVIKSFTSKLMDTMMGTCDVPHKELLDASTFHGHLSSRAEKHLDETRRKFTNYVDALYHLYQTETQTQYHRSATNCIAIGYALGAWLDATVFQ